MEFKKRLLTALEACYCDKELLQLVREIQQVAGQKRAVYEILHEVWSELGFDLRSDGGKMQDDLEYLMEAVWFECPMPETARGP